LIFNPYFFEPWSPLRKSPESFGPAPPKAGKLSAFSFELILPLITQQMKSSGSPKGQTILK
jgi:hypothetical protein